MTEKTGDGAVTGMLLMTEGERLDRGAVPELQGQIVHERQTGGNSDNNGRQACDKPG